jgi:hypothetical protein
MRPFAVCGRGWAGDLYWGLALPTSMRAEVACGTSKINGHAPGLHVGAARERKVGSQA